MIDQQFSKDTSKTTVMPDIEEILNSSTSSVDDNELVETQINIAEENGFSYVAGWIAKKFKNEFPQLGSLTTNYKYIEHQYSLPTWLNHLSFGGLTSPSDEWMQVVTSMEKKFNKYNGKYQLSKKPNISTILTNKICKKQNIFPKKVIKAYILQRIFIRIKYLNLKIKEEQNNKSLKRKYNSKDTEGHKKGKKLKKVLT